jgi:hypothetical protein
MPRAATSVETRIGSRPLRNASEAVGRELLGELRRVDAAIHEQETARVAREQQHVHERGVGLVAPDRVGDVLDVGMRVAGLRPLERQRILLEAIGQGLHRVGEGRGHEMG